jgi:hypothetical protein
MVLSKERQVDRIRHRLVSRIVRMKVVTAVVFQQNTGRVVWVTDSRIEVHDSVHILCGAYPLVECLSRLLPDAVFFAIFIGAAQNEVTKNGFLNLGK